MSQENRRRRPQWVPGNATIIAVATLLAAVASLIAALMENGPA
ncbi:hypothetical protein [Actinoplanes xinjiangensis]|jgi:hypothetical protein|uniref:Uncharacterized protein n=1 Tax=Actinoplanes xinjiangensis TaxID=512350 RepID=A0A316FXK4_9ACTN|nr:hypothetical protein [Actinoplanes xinjiangensis]PWK52406.1 hypothetical protein BC793_101415 [Actinoplanes xinjiangensis]GIF36894.1 hypothetical protein Axi01nite_12050 [Actinoplanes xinjiangensis]